MMSWWNGLVLQLSWEQQSKCSENINRIYKFVFPEENIKAEIEQILGSGSILFSTGGFSRSFSEEFWAVNQTNQLWNESQYCKLWFEAKKYLIIWERYSTLYYVFLTRQCIQWSIAIADSDIIHNALWEGQLGLSSFGMVLWFLFPYISCECVCCVSSCGWMLSNQLNHI